MKYAVIALVWMVFYRASAQYYHLEGKLGNEPVVVDLLKTPQKIRGTYYGLNRKVPLELTGKEVQGKWVLEEIDFQNNTTGTWELEVQGTRFSGTWKHAQQSLSIALTETQPTGLKFKSIEFDKTYKPSPLYGLTYYKQLVFPVPSLSPNRTATKMICDSLLPNFNLKVKEWNEELIRAELHKEFEKMQKEYQSFIGGSKDICENAPMGCQWEEYQVAYPVFNQNSLLVYRDVVSTYEGGAHGTFVVWHINFNAQNGQILTLDRLFKPGYEKPVTEIIKKKFQAKYQTQDLEAVRLDEVFVSENFQISYGGIVFHYNPYEIGPYSIGAPKIFVPYDELKPYLIEKHPFVWIK